MSDTGKLPGSDEEKVGYGHPPKETRFNGTRPNKINRHGRPKSFDQWRKLNIAILQEIARDAKGEPIIIDGHIATNAEMVSRSKLKDPKHQNDVIEAAYGKVPQPIDVTTGGKSLEKADNAERFDRAILTLADAIRESISGEGAGSDGTVDTTEQAPVVGAPKPGG